MKKVYNYIMGKTNEVIDKKQEPKALNHFYEAGGKAGESLQHLNSFAKNMAKIGSNCYSGIQIYQAIAGRVLLSRVASSAYMFAKPTATAAMIDAATKTTAMAMVTHPVTCAAVVVVGTAYYLADKEVMNSVNELCGAGKTSKEAIEKLIKSGATMLGIDEFKQVQQSAEEFEKHLQNNTINILQEALSSDGANEQKSSEQPITRKEKNALQNKQIETIDPEIEIDGGWVEVDTNKKNDLLMSTSVMTTKSDKQKYLAHLESKGNTHKPKTHVQKLQDQRKSASKGGSKGRD